MGRFVVVENCGREERGMRCVLGGVLLKFAAASLLTVARTHSSQLLGVLLVSRCDSWCLGVRSWCRGVLVSSCSRFVRPVVCCVRCCGARWCSFRSYGSYEHEHVKGEAL